MSEEDETLYSAGQAAQAAGVTRKAVRVYEERGLLPPPGRTVSGYRVFTGEDVAVLRFIRRARTLGMTLAEVGEVLGLQRGAQPCAQAIGLLDARLEQLGRTVSELNRLRSSLLAARRSAQEARRSGQDTVTCQVTGRP